MTHVGTGRERTQPPSSVNYRGLTLLAALWAWLIAVVFPVVVWGSGARWPLGLFFPLVVMLGLLHRSLRVRRIALLIIAPATLCLAVFFRDELTGADAWDASVRTVLAVAAAAYLLAAAAYCEQRVLRASEGERLPASALTPIDARKRLIQRAFLAFITLASVALLTVAPRFGATGESSELLLASVTGLILALGLLGTQFGPSLRTNNTKQIPENTHWLLLSFAVVAFWAFVVLRYLDLR